MTDEKSDLGSLLIQFAKANGLEWTKDDTGVACLMNGGHTLTIFNKPTIIASSTHRSIIYGTVYYPDRKPYPIRFVDDITITLLRKEIAESLLGQTAGQMDGG